MITYPCAKINLGLNIVRKRPDGYHDLQTVFYPLPLHDTIEAFVIHPSYPLQTPCSIKTHGIRIEGSEQDNLVARAFRLLQDEGYINKESRVHFNIYKSIPSQAGMGGGSADGAYTLRLLNELFALGLNAAKLEAMAARLGADCPFFVQSRPVYAEGIGEKMQPISLDLAGLYVGIVKPDIAVPTREAFAHVVPQVPQHCCRDVVAQPIETWRRQLTNDFETSVFAQHPQLAHIKQKLYDLGAVYAAMSGSGSALFGIFSEPVVNFSEQFPNDYVFFNIFK